MVWYCIHHINCLEFNNLRKNKIKENDTDLNFDDKRRNNKIRTNNNDVGIRRHLKVVAVEAAAAAVAVVVGEMHFHHKDY